MMKFGFAASALVLLLGVAGASAESSGQAVKDHIDQQNELFSHSNGMYGAPYDRRMNGSGLSGSSPNDYQQANQQWRSTENPGG